MCYHSNTFLSRGLFPVFIAVMLGTGRNSYCSLTLSKITKTSEDIRAKVLLITTLKVVVVHFCNVFVESKNKIYNGTILIAYFTDDGINFILILHTYE